LAECPWTVLVTQCASLGGGGTGAGGQPAEVHLPCSENGVSVSPERPVKTTNAAMEAQGLEPRSSEGKAGGLSDPSFSPKRLQTAAEHQGGFLSFCFPSHP